MCLLVSVPYAMKAAVADTLAGHSASEFVTTDNLQSAVQQLQGQATTVAAGTPTGTNSKSTAAGTRARPDQPGHQLRGQHDQPGGAGAAERNGHWPEREFTQQRWRAGNGQLHRQGGSRGRRRRHLLLTNGFGMFGYSTAASGGIGIQGRSDSANGVGFAGWAIGTSGIAINAVETSTSGNPVGAVAKVSAPTGYRSANHQRRELER